MGAWPIWRTGLESLARPGACFVGGHGRQAHARDGALQADPRGGGRALAGEEGLHQEAHAEPRLSERNTWGQRQGEESFRVWFVKDGKGICRSVVPSAACSLGGNLPARVWLPYVSHQPFVRRCTGLYQTN